MNQSDSNGFEGARRGRPQRQQGNSHRYLPYIRPTTDQNSNIEAEDLPPYFDSPYQFAQPLNPPAENVLPPNGTLAFTNSTYLATAIQASQIGELDFGLNHTTLYNGGVDFSNTSASISAQIQGSRIESFSPQVIGCNVKEYHARRQAPEKYLPPQQQTSAPPPSSQALVTQMGNVNQGQSSQSMAQEIQFLHQQQQSGPSRLALQPAIDQPQQPVSDAQNHNATVDGGVYTIMDANIAAQIQDTQIESFSPPVMSKISCNVKEYYWRQQAPEAYLPKQQQVQTLAPVPSYQILTTQMGNMNLYQGQPSQPMAREIQLLHQQQQQPGPSRLVRQPAVDQQQQPVPVAQNRVLQPLPPLAHTTFRPNHALESNTNEVIYGRPIKAQLINSKEIEGNPKEKGNTRGRPRGRIDGKNEKQLAKDLPHTHRALGRLELLKMVFQYAKEQYDSSNKNDIEEVKRSKVMTDCERVLEKARESIRIIHEGEARPPIFLNENTQVLEVTSEYFMIVFVRFGQILRYVEDINVQQNHHFELWMDIGNSMGYWENVSIEANLSVVVDYGDDGGDGVEWFDDK